MKWNRILLAGAFLICCLWLGSETSARSQPLGKGKGKDADHAADREVFQYLFQHREHIQRTVKNTEMGVETLTESNKPEIAAKIKEHVVAMHKRVKEGRGIHLRDPLFAAIFQNVAKIDMQIELTQKGVKVVETSKDPHVALMVQAHAQVVSNFIKNGHSEAMKNHEVPPPPPAK